MQKYFLVFAALTSLIGSGISFANDSSGSNNTPSPLQIAVNACARAASSFSQPPFGSMRLSRTDVLLSAGPRNVPMMEADCGGLAKQAADTPDVAQIRAVSNKIAADLFAALPVDGVPIGSSGQVGKDYSPNQMIHISCNQSDVTLCSILIEPAASLSSGQ